MANHPAFIKSRIQDNEHHPKPKPNGGDDIRSSFERDVDNNKNPEHESLEDSFKDMANYAIIGLLVLRDKWDK